MIRAGILRDAGRMGWRIEGNVTLDMIGQRIQMINAQEYGAPIRLYGEQIKSGGMLNSSIEYCLIIENAMHPKDYFRFCITTRRQGTKTIITMYYYGGSTLTVAAELTEERRRSGSLGGLLINAFAGVNEAAYIAEYDYYDIVFAIFERLF